MRPWRLVRALLLTFVSTMIPPQAPAAEAPAPIREPQLISAPNDALPQGKCDKRRFVWARAGLDIAADGSPQQVEIVEASESNAKDLAMGAVRGDRFTPAQQDGKAVPVHRNILFETFVCAQKVKLPDGREEKQVRPESLPKQTLYPTAAPPTAIPGVNKVGGNITAPIAINAPEASFTSDARKAKVQGDVIISVVVDADGIAHDPRVLKPLPAGLTEAAIAALRKYRFKPAMKDGKTPVPVLVTIGVNFRLY